MDNFKQNVDKFLLEFRIKLQSDRGNLNQGKKLHKLIHLETA